MVRSHRCPAAGPGPWSRPALLSCRPFSQLPPPGRPPGPLLPLHWLPASCPSVLQCVCWGWELTTASAFLGEPHPTCSAADWLGRAPGPPCEMQPEPSRLLLPRAQAERRRSSGPRSGGSVWLLCMLETSGGGRGGWSGDGAVSEGSLACAGQYRAPDSGAPGAGPARRGRQAGFRAHTAFTVGGPRTRDTAQASHPARQHMGTPKSCPCVTELRTPRRVTPLG